VAIKRWLHRKIPASERHFFQWLSFLVRSDIQYMSNIWVWMPQDGTAIGGRHST
jgi:hypothetical protein